MKELIENVKNLQATYQDVFNISNTLQSKDTENKFDVLLELNNNTIPVWKKGTTITVDDSILSRLKKSKMLQKSLIKIRTFPGAKIQDMKFFVVPHLKKKPDNIIIYVGTNNAPRSSSYEIFHEIQSLKNFILKYLPSERIIISTLVLSVDKANASDVNKAFTDLIKESNLDYISHENIKKSHIDEYGLCINRTGSSRY